MIERKDDFVALIEYLGAFDDPSNAGAGRVHFRMGDLDLKMNGIADENRFRKTDFVIAIANLETVTGVGVIFEADCSGQCQRSVRHSLLIHSVFGVFIVQMYREKIARVACVKNDIGLRYRAATGVVSITNHVTIKMIISHVYAHFVSRLTVNIGSVFVGSTAFGLL